MAHSPNANERSLLDQIYDGQVGILPFQRAPISAPFLREHILEINSTASSGHSGRAVRWVIHNAIFAEELDLRDGCRPGGGSLPALEFVNCKFNAGFCADGARIERVRFEKCVFVANENAEDFGLSVEHGNGDRGEFPAEEKQRKLEATTGEGDVQQDAKLVTAEKGQRREPRNRISLRNCRIETELCLEWLKPHDFDDKPGILIVDAFAATVGANVMVRNTTLRAPRGESSATLPEPHYALDLSTADIGSDVRLNPSVVLEGGLKMRDARIGGSFWAAGLNVTDGENDVSRAAIRKQGDTSRHGLKMETTNVQGNLVLGIDYNELLQTAKAGGWRPKKPSEEQPGTDNSAGDDEKKAPNAEGHKKEEDFDLGMFMTRRLFQSIGDVSLLNATVEGDIDLSGVVVQGTLAMSGLTVRGSVRALRKLDETLKGMLPLRIQDQTQFPLTVDKDIWLNNCHIKDDCELSAKTNSINLTGGVLGGRANFDGVAYFFDAPGVTTAGDLRVAFEGMYRCNLEGAKIEGTFDLLEASFEKTAVLNVQNSEVKVSIELAKMVLEPLAVRRWSLKCYPEFYLTEILLNRGGRT